MSKSHLIIRTLILVPIFAGCQQSEQVTVSGAVAKPGTYRRLPFSQVSENVANGYFVETMQASWMLSAGHRSNILARHWTHVGVAVAKDRGMVWGVQVFARQ